MAYIIVVENNIERIDEFKSLSMQVGYENVIHFLSSGEELINFINNNVANIDQLPDLIFFNITLPVVNGKSFLFEFENFPLAVKDKIQVITYSNYIGDRFFIANDLNYQPIDIASDYSEVFDSFILSDSIKCFA